MATQPLVDATITSSPAAPDWNSITQEILCPLCDYNLRGLVEPRCPECGYRFVWADLLDPTRRLHPYLFEHHPERSFWSFRKTLLGGLRPTRFWKTLSPVQPSSPRRLVRYWVSFVIIWAILLTATSVPGFVALSAFNVRQVAKNRAAEAGYLAYLKSPKGAEELKRVKQQYGSVEAALADWFPTSGVFQLAARLILMGIWYSLPFTLLVLAWPWLSILSLLLFQISMRRKRINRLHVARCVLYSQDMPLLIGIAVLLASHVGFIAMGVGTSAVLNTVNALVDFLQVSAIALLTYRLSRAYKYYLRFDHPVWTAVASQALTFLLSLNILLAMTVWW